MIVVALCGVGLGADRGPFDRLIEQLRSGDAPARRAAALRIGLLGPRAAFAIEALDSALDDPDHYFRAVAAGPARRPIRRLQPLLVLQPPRLGGKANDATSVAVTISGPCSFRMPHRRIPGPIFVDRTSRE
jgi:hypothetical protein